jgi:hypothetical protein
MKVSTKPEQDHGAVIRVIQQTLFRKRGLKSKRTKSHHKEFWLDARDRALLLFGFAGAFRRAELVALLPHTGVEGLAHRGRDLERCSLSSHVCP